MGGAGGGEGEVGGVCLVGWLLGWLFCCCFSSRCQFSAESGFVGTVACVVMLLIF